MHACAAQLRPRGAWIGLTAREVYGENLLLSRNSPKMESFAYSGNLDWRRALLKQGARDLLADTPLAELATPLQFWLLELENILPQAELDKVGELLKKSFVKHGETLGSPNKSERTRSPTRRSPSGRGRAPVRIGTAG